MKQTIQEMYENIFEDQFILREDSSPEQQSSEDIQKQFKYDKILKILISLSGISIAMIASYSIYKKIKINKELINSQKRLIDKIYHALPEKIPFNKNYLTAISVILLSKIGQIILFYYKNKCKKNYQTKE